MPGGLITLGIGYSFQKAYGNYALLIGAPVILIGAHICATAQLFMGRFLLKDMLQERAAKFKYFVAIDRAVEKEVRRILIRNIGTKVDDFTQDVPRNSFHITKLSTWPD